jgi:hypothetical protein
VPRRSHSAGGTLDDKTMTGRFGDHSAFTQRYVEKKKVRSNIAKISRPEQQRSEADFSFTRTVDSTQYLHAVPDTYMAWVGVRFRDEEWMTQNAPF